MKRLIPHLIVAGIIALAILGSIDVCVVALSWTNEQLNIRNTSSPKVLHRLGLPTSFHPRGYRGQDAGPWPLLMASSPAYDGEKWAEEYWQLELSYYESLRYEQGSQFQPNVIWRTSPRRSRFVNVDADGIRATTNDSARKTTNTVSVHLFGASTAFGTGVPDQYTIPSLLSRELSTPAFTFSVKNYGTGSFILQQDIQLFVDTVLKAEKPSIAIFYHGANDSYGGMFSPAKLGWYLGSDQIEKKLSGSSYGRRRSLFEDLPIYRALLSPVIGPPLRSQEENPFLDDYSLRAQQFVAFYIETLRLLDRICKAYGVHCFYFWQPVLFFSKKSFSPFEQAMLDHPSLLSIGTFDEQHGRFQEKAMSAAYSAIVKTPPPLSTFYNLGSVFDSRPETIFVDYVHVGRMGNYLVAKEIAAAVLTNR